MMELQNQQARLLPCPGQKPGKIGSDLVVLDLVAKYSFYDANHLIRFHCKAVMGLPTFSPEGGGHCESKLRTLRYVLRCRKVRLSLWLQADSLASRLDVNSFVGGPKTACHCTTTVLPTVARRIRKVGTVVGLAGYV